MIADKRVKFKNLLKTIFHYQQDKLSLDFGIYRVFRHKARELEGFLEEALPELADQAAQKYGIEPEDAYNDVLNFFSRYYQDGDFYPTPQFGGQGTHVIRYNGEEVVFTWANREQYYIKSLTEFSEYRIRDLLPAHLFPDYPNVLTFAVGKVEEVKGDQKKARSFVLDPGGTRWDENGLTVTFDYVSKKEGAATAEALQKHLQEQEVTLDLGVVEHHLKRFQTLRKSDFFIHKNLRAFLGSQLQFYIKNEVFQVDDAYSLKRGRAALEAGQSVIDFLHRLEDLQKRLWEKRKFVYDVHYIVTLNRVAQWAPEWLRDHLPEIVATQRESWQALGLGEYADTQAVLRNPPGMLLDGPPSFLPLPVDTRLFDQDFRWSLLEAISVTGTLDQRLDGIAVHSDNWQALNTLGKRFRESVKCIYIDPPYNTGTDGFPYKDGYPHSSWLSMIEDRLRAAKPLMREKGALFCSIDYHERSNLEAVLNRVFGPENRAEEIIWVQNTTKNQSPTYSTNHEYVEVYARNLEQAKRDERMFREPKPGAAEVLELVERLGPEYLSIQRVEQAIAELFHQHRTELREEMESQGQEYDRNFDPWKGLYNYNHAEYRDADGRMVPEQEAKARNAKLWVWQDGDASAPAGKQSPTTKVQTDPNYRYYRPVHPVTGAQFSHPKSGWRWPQHPDPSNPSRPSFTAMDADDRIIWGDGGTGRRSVLRHKKFLHEVDTQVAQSVVLDATNGEAELSAMAGASNTFRNPKPTSLIARFIAQTTDDGEWVMDFFAGSGTTFQAALSAFHDDGFKRRVLLVEAGPHYETTLLPRLQRAASAWQWKKGKPVMVNGPGCFIKLLKLEQYEETLENSVLQPADEVDVQARMNAVAQLTALPDLYRDQYLATLPHFVETASPALLAAFEDDWLAHPFNFRLKVQGSGGTFEERTIDLPETFSLWLGQEVSRVKRFEYHGRTRYVVEGDSIVCYWRDLPKPQELTREYVEGDLQLLNQHVEITGQTLYMNGIAQHHPLGWLPPGVKETLYELRALMLERVAE